MECPHCKKDIKDAYILMPAYDMGMSTGSKSMTRDYYEYVKEQVHKFLSCVFICSMDYNWLENEEEGIARLKREGYTSRSTGCDWEWIWRKKDE